MSDRIISHLCWWFPDTPHEQHLLTGCALLTGIRTIVVGSTVQRYRCPGSTVYRRIYGRWAGRRGLLSTGVLEYYSSY